MALLKGRYLRIPKNQQKKKQSMCPKSLEYISDRKIDTWIKTLCSSASGVSIENLQEQSTELYKTFTSCVVMPLLWFCSLAALCAASRRGTAGTMGSQWHSRIRWRSQLRLHTSLAVTPLCWHLDTLTSKTNFSRPKIVGNVCETTPKASPGCRRHWASMSERQIALEASPQIRTHWFLRLQPIIFQDCEASPNLAVLLGLQATNDTNIHLTAFHQKLGDLPHKEADSYGSSLTFPLRFYTSTPLPSELRWLHQFLDNSRDWSYWRHRQCTAMSTPPVAEPNLATQELIFGLTNYHTEMMSNLQKHIHWDLFHPPCKIFSYLQPPEQTEHPGSCSPPAMPNPGFATSTSKQQRKTTNGNTGATKAETKRTVAPSSKKRERERCGHGTKKIRTSLDVLSRLILFCLAPCFFRTKEESNTNI